MGSRVSFLALGEKVWPISRVNQACLICTIVILGKFEWTEMYFFANYSEYENKCANILRVFVKLRGFFHSEILFSFNRTGAEL